MRGDQALPKLCENILDFVCDHMSAHVGALYLGAVRQFQPGFPGI
jgi:hypothetical protein